MGFLKFAGGVVGIFVAFVVVMKLLKIVLGLIWLAIVFCALGLVCYGVYRLVSSGAEKAPSE
jgi:hypothetical protein